ncbi:microtubule-associated protein tau isoform X2 [Prorops nasuta]|uniref:microtubule-associated protein tau isoform X2 n=1 Tax=Prorops nasuta TaxID=863751 RepID=UPI0034CE694C
MDSQETNSNIGDPGRGPTPVKQNPPLPPGAQFRPQGQPSGSPRPPLNSYPPNAPRPGAPPAPLRRLDSRPSLGPPIGPIPPGLPGQPTHLNQPSQLRPYGPPRPPGNPFPPRSPQPNQHPQNLQNFGPNQTVHNQPQLNPQNFAPRFPQGQAGLRSPGPQIGPRPPFLPNQQSQQLQRNGSEQRVYSQNGQQPHLVFNQSGVPNQTRAGQDPSAPRQIQRNESTVNLSRQNSSNQEDRQSTRPRIVIENMTEVEKQIPDSFGQKKRPEVRDDDDDDVVMDVEKSPRYIGSNNEGLLDPSKSPSNKSLDEKNFSRPQSASRPSTAKSEDKNVDPNVAGEKRESSSRPASSRINQRTSSRSSDSIEESQEEQLHDESKITPVRTNSSPGSAVQSSPLREPDRGSLNDDQQRTFQRSPEISRSSTPGTDVVVGSSRSETPLKNLSSNENSAVNLSRPASGLEMQKSPIPMAKSESQEKISMLAPKSPQESVKGFDNGQRRSLSSKSSPTTPSPQSPNPPNIPRSLPIKDMTVEDEKEEDTFVDDKSDNDKEGKIPKTPEGSSNDSKHRVQTPDAPEIQNGRASKVRGNLPISNGISSTPKKSTREGDKKSSSAGSPVKSPSKSTKSLPKTPDTPTSTGSQDKKKLPMNKIQVGAAPSPNLKVVRSKIGSLENASHKPGGGKIKIENRKLDFSKAQPKIAAKNDKYTPSGGDKKIEHVKLQWNAKSKIGSLENATHKPGGGDKKIETVKLDFKDKAKPKVGSKDNAKHVPGGGAVKIPTQKIEIKAESKIGSLDNVKHKPGGGDKKIFDDKNYLRQTSSNVESLSGSGSQSPVPSGAFTNSKNGLPTSDENLNQEC